MLPALAQSRDALDSLSAKLTTTALDAFIYHCKTCSALSRVLNLKNLLETFSTLHLSLHAVSCFFVISHQLETTGTQFLTVELLCPTNMLVDCELGVATHPSHSHIQPWSSESMQCFNLFQYWWWSSRWQINFKKYGVAVKRYRTKYY
jgi:hypothetical protein